MVYTNMVWGCTFRVCGVIRVWEYIVWWYIPLWPSGCGGMYLLNKGGGGGAVMVLWYRYTFIFMASALTLRSSLTDSMKPW